MPGRMTVESMEQLEQWIGTGPKSFTLLYDLINDGCRAETFHKKCDNQGPTVVVLYNKKNSIFGGYTAISWDPSGGPHGKDDAAFMFRLQHSGTSSPDKFPCIQPQYAIYRSSSYGPTFGGNGRHYIAFEQTVHSTGCYFKLNSNISSWNEIFDCHDVTTADVDNNDSTVLNLEVYKVTDEPRNKAELNKPWRETAELNAKSLEDLKSTVELFSPSPVLNVPESMILVLGPVGSGKSSFFNTVASIFRGRITRQASSGSAEQSITSQYRMYRVVNSSSGRPLNFRICDTRGLEENQQKDASDIMYLLDGHVPEGYDFNPSVPISPQILGFKKSPSLKDKIHCVCFVIDGSTAGVLPESILERIKAIQSNIYRKGVPQMVLLTKIDKICPMVENDVSRVFISKAILEQVTKISQLLGIPRNNIFPVKNYESEIKLNNNVSVLALVALNEMLNASDDFLYNFMDETHLGSDSDNAPLNTKD